MRRPPAASEDLKAFRAFVENDTWAAPGSVRGNYRALLAEIDRMSVGRCGATMPTVFEPDWYLHCTLYSGHTGMHHDVSGTDWLEMAGAGELEALRAELAAEREAARSNALREGRLVAGMTVLREAAELVIDAFTWPGAGGLRPDFASLRQHRDRTLAALVALRNAVELSKR